MTNSFFVPQEEQSHNGRPASPVNSGDKPQRTIQFFIGQRQQCHIATVALGFLPDLGSS
ncbi:MAG TPA: hypothetical protein PK393_07505 [Synergistaceae bacterium]|nr:hypothetical protein [Synergistaceae bacterium]